MPEAILTILKFCLLALLYLFLFGVLRSVWRELAWEPTAATSAKAASAGAGLRKRQSRAPKHASDDAKGARTPITGGNVKLRVLEPSAMRGRIFVVGKQITIGRASACGVVLNDNFVSQEHARVYALNGEFFLEDLGSTNGTNVNNRPVTKAVGLCQGDRLQIGETVFEVTQ